MGRRHDDRSIQRRRPSREPKYRILVVCEGKKTEPGYLRQLQHHVRNLRVHVEPVGPAGVPVTVVRKALELRKQAEHEARRQRDENLLWDQVWAVFDMDEHPNVTDARQLAIANDIRLAISNPCFELWALLHFADQRAHLERDDARAKLQQHVRGYDKELPFARIHAGYDAAVRRARELDAAAERAGRPGRNPTTGIHVLTEIIRTQ